MGESRDLIFVALELISYKPSRIKILHSDISVTNLKFSLAKISTNECMERETGAGSESFFMIIEIT